MEPFDIDQIVYGPDLPDEMYEDPAEPAPGAAEANRQLGYAVRYTKQMAAEAAAVDQVLDEIRERWEERKAKLEKRIAWHADAVEGWHRAAVADGGAKTVHLPAGKLELRRPPQAKVTVVDEEAFRAFLDGQKTDDGGTWEDLVYTAPEPKKEFKVTQLRKLVPKPKRKEPGSVYRYVTEDGEVVPGVQIFEPPAKFSFGE